MGDLKYGPVKNEASVAKIPFPMGASEVIKAKSGRFVKNDGSGRAEIAGAGNTLLIGWVELGEQTCSATEGGTVGALIPAIGCNVVFRIPINSGTFTAAMRGQTCDLSVASSIQGAALGLSSDDPVYIVDGDLVNNAWVEVMLYPPKFTGVTGVV